MISGQAIEAPFGVSVFGSSVLRVTPDLVSLQFAVSHLAQHPGEAFRRLATLTAQQKRQFLPLAPDFVVELRSETDSLTTLQAKMSEYRDNGVALGLLLDPGTRRAWIYRPNVPTAEVADPATIDCSPELPGFVLDTAAIFNADL